MISKSGMPLFQKEYVANEKIKVGPLAGLVTGMNLKCYNIVQKPCCYLEFSKSFASI